MAGTDFLPVNPENDMVPRHRNDHVHNLSVLFNDNYWDYIISDMLDDILRMEHQCNETDRI